MRRLDRRVDKLSVNNIYKYFIENQFIHADFPGNFVMYLFFYTNDFFRVEM